MAGTEDVSRTSTWDLVRRVALLDLYTVPIAVDTAYACGRGWSPRSLWPFILLGFLMAPAALSLVAVATSRGRSIVRSRTPHLLALIISTGCSLGIVECLLRSVPTLRGASASLHLRAPNLRVTFHPDTTILPGASPEARFSTNSLGIRGPELPTDGSGSRILCVGGSTTECLYLDDERTWPCGLMAELDARCPHAWVGNVGTSGYSTVEHGEFLRSACVVHHVDAIVLMVGINDLQRTLMDNLYSEWPGPVWYRSRTAALLRMQVWQRLSGRFLGAILNETDSASSYTLRRRERRAAPIARDVDLEAGLPGYADRLRALVSMCRDLGARPILVTQPVLWKKDLTEREESLLWLGRTRSGSYLSTLDARRGIDLYNGVLRAVARETGVACVDLESMSGCSRFFYDDCHFTERGASRVVELLAGDVRRCLSGASK